MGGWVGWAGGSAQRRCGESGVRWARFGGGKAHVDHCVLVRWCGFAWNHVQTKYYSSKALDGFGSCACPQLTTCGLADFRSPRQRTGSGWRVSSKRCCGSFVSASTFFLVLLFCVRPFSREREREKERERNHNKHTGTQRTKERERERKASD